MPKQNSNNNTNITQADLVAALDAIFRDEKLGWTVPDEAIEGPYKRRIEQLEARVNHLTEELLKLKGVEPEPEQKGRIDVAEAAKKKGKK